MNSFIVYLLHRLINVMLVMAKAEIVPQSGERFICPTTGYTTLRFRRPGFDGEFHFQVKLEYTPKFKSPMS